jgi:hypothetical protein
MFREVRIFFTRNINRYYFPLDIVPTYHFENCWIILFIDFFLYNLTTEIKKKYIAPPTK